ncbi:sigma-54 interaction domain-containing protein [Psychrobacillus soli]|uniref:AAA family ATPase n=1 Tax=Psychrobacillus soli TaxID=1543965 RepID=A0A544TFI9_9BACI|nr:sigma 54-interacting transcriptional regulator [Psychrobacillus soli]TQR16199.1 AAA family ATPase [Psychrobacillus soli]
MRIYSTKWWEKVIVSINDGILVIDEFEKVLFINPEYSRITGVGKEIIGKLLSGFRPGAQLPETLKDGKTRVGIYREINGCAYVVDMAPIEDNGKIIGAVSVCKGINEVKALSNELNKKVKQVIELQEKITKLSSVKYSFEQIITQSSEMLDNKHIAKKIASSNLPVLLIGESGTGKELFSQSIHDASDRRDHPFIAVNCATIPDTLIESELFGYVEGAFTSAKKGGKVGLFEMANNGTLFLDEIGDLSYNVQANLLRVLQEGTIRRIGDTKEVKVDVRIIAATHQDLNQMAQKYKFRQDLYYRLNVAHITIPPLRNRKEDIPLLVKRFLPTNYQLHNDVLQFLQSYNWPGNIRELKNMLSYAACLADDGVIELEHLPEVMRNQIVDDSIQTDGTLRSVVESAEARYINQMLKRYEKNIEGRRLAASNLGISLASLYNKIRKYKLE